MSTIEAALQMALDAFELTSDAFEAKYYPEAGPQNIINTIRAAIERESRRDAALAEHRRQGDEMELEILKLTAERDQLREELESLRRWKDLHDNAPDDAKQIIIERMQRSYAIQPIIEDWRKANNALTGEVKELREALRECVGALDEIIDLVAAARDGEYEFDSLSAQPCREALATARKALGEEDSSC